MLIAQLLSAIFCLRLAVCPVLSINGECVVGSFCDIAGGVVLQGFRRVIEQIQRGAEHEACAWPLSAVRRSGEGYVSPAARGGEQEERGGRGERAAGRPPQSAFHRVAVLREQEGI